jgi:molecular chaperone GrpE
LKMATEPDHEAECQDRYLRLAAEFDNFKKRARREQREIRKHAAADVAARLLPVLDDAERAMQHVPEGTDAGWLRGIQLTLQKLHDMLASVGVEPIEAVGAAFDPKLHEAIGSEESSEQPEGTVVSELRRGYRTHDRVLRPSLVKLARRPVQDESSRPDGSREEHA